jgi:hypothetical protein
MSFTEWHIRGASLTSAAQASRSINRQGHHSTIIALLSLSQEAIVAKRLGERGGHSVKFRLFRDPETAGSPQGGSLGATG